ncbi:Oxidoreductase [Croceitalea dokdonensis DOKDO 023]|uniref:Oxidoreductase n=1 Tax=Croceitalea dokdonensis DOKDO 023 TaxID=1300341 RepID=A0A0P7AFE5_9FLAO|nr:FAD-dependent oxidoreductase [Croceitalea dokdonensis]KPM30845.1 Oxidoreductase [Croceitalea dokdonensis DOKDO 023]
MEFSYWEYKSWFSNVDFAIIGSGIVGLSAALRLRQRFPHAKILIIEKGMLPQGASTKNAGFACFGSISEVLSDLGAHTEEEVVQLVQQRFNGIQLLRKTLGDKAIGFQQLGGHELFLKKDQLLFESCLAAIPRLNQLLRPVFGTSVFKTTPNTFGFKSIQNKYLTQLLEGQIDTGRMMGSLLQKASEKRIQVVNNVRVNSFQENANAVHVSTDRFEFKTSKLLVATNGFTSQFGKSEVLPARAQVLITKPLKNLAIQGTFHFDEGYYYFRNIDDRILFGGGRNLDFKTEETMEFGQTALVQNKLENLLREVILPHTPFEVEHRWSGIMGVGPKKKPVVQQVTEHVYYGVRLGGMGIAIGSLVGKELADLL